MSDKIRDAFDEYCLICEDVIYADEDSFNAGYKAGRASMHKEVMEALPKIFNEQGEPYINIYSAEQIHERLKDLT